MKLINNITGRIRLWWILRKVLRDQTASGAVLSVQDILPPEENATLQSLNSRSDGGFLVNLTKVILKGGAKVFMKKYYRSGYGHKSIADCGSSTVSFDGISMLAAKAIQDHPLYNGQETSTRYIKMSGSYVDPGENHPRTQKLFDVWFTFYRESLPKVIEHLTKKHPVPDGKDAAKWAVTLEKRAYDIMGAFLPAGTRTNVSCHMNLRQFEDKMATMRHHPVTEIKELAQKMHELLQKKYPGTFSEKLYPDTEAFNAQFMKELYFAKDETGNIQTGFQGFFAHANFFHDFQLKRYEDLLKTRKEKTEFPKVLNQTGSFQFDFLIDYRSFRDLQRQRSATQKMPLLTMEYGFEEFYLESLPEDVRAEAEKLLAEQKAELESYNFPGEYMQYFIPMGYKVFTRFTVGLADLIYIIELRTPTTVHPTAREIAKKMYIFLRQHLSEDIPVYANMSEDELNIKRADQDIFIGGKSISEK